MKKIYLVVALLLMSFSSLSHANRLIGAGGDIYASRCYANELPLAECTAYRDQAYYGIPAWGVPGCITLEEYDYAKANSLAPICSFIPGATPVLFAVCTCGCFEEGTKLSVAELRTGRKRLASIEEIVNNASHFAAYSATDNSTLGTLAFEARNLNRVTSGPEDKPLVIIKTESGKRIGLSGKHAILLASGNMVKAEELNVGDLMVQENGLSDAVVEITEGKKDQMVYNLLTKSSTENGHLVIAEGLVVGDLYWQNIVDADIKKFKMRQ